jgi:hypothetical protein
MTSTLVHLPTPHLRQPADALALHGVCVPAPIAGEARLEAALEQHALSYDARAIWIGYPNLQRAAFGLVEQLSADWPCRGQPDASAAIQAVVLAIRDVCHGLERRENSREQITANFLQGLASAAADTAGTVAWGFRGVKPVEPFELWSGSFERWCRDNALTDVRFYRSGGPSSCETEGTRLKLLCAVATARDVGIAIRWRTAS